MINAPSPEADRQLKYHCDRLHHELNKLTVSIPYDPLHSICIRIMGHYSKENTFRFNYYEAKWACDQAVKVIVFYHKAHANLRAKGYRATAND